MPGYTEHRKTKPSGKKVGFFFPLSSLTKSYIYREIEWKNKIVIHLICSRKKNKPNAIVDKEMFKARIVHMFSVDQIQKIY